MSGVRVIDRSVAYDNPILKLGHQVGIQVDYHGLVRDIEPFTLMVPGTNGKWYPLSPIAVVSSVSSAVYTMDSSAQADKFDPTDSDVNEQWLTENGGAQTVTFFDQSADYDLYGAAQSGGGNMATETEVVASVSGADLTTSAAFSTAPEANDVFFPGGCNSANVMMEAVIITEKITVERAESEQYDFISTIAYGAGTVLSYDRLPTAIGDLVTASVVPSTGTVNIKIDLDR